MMCQGLFFVGLFSEIETILLAKDNSTFKYSNFYFLGTHIILKMRLFSES